MTQGCGIIGTVFDDLRKIQVTIIRNILGTKIAFKNYKI